VAHLKVFGCDAFVHVPTEKRSKLDNKAIRCIFIGYKEGMKGYKLWNPASRRIMYSRDVVFREFRGNFEHEEVVHTENNPNIIWFELRNEEYDSDESIEFEEEVEQMTPVVKSSEKVKKPVERYSSPEFRFSFMLTTINDEPKSFSEAVDLVEGKLSKDAMVEEMESLYKNETWDLVKLPSGRNHVGSKWVFTKKMNDVGQVKKFKSRLVVKGYSQVEGVDFSEIFSPVAKLTSIRILMSLAVTLDLDIEQMDVKIVFLHGDLEEEIYMRQPEGFVVKGKQELVCKIKRSIYGLKQSPRMWYHNFYTYILSLGFVRSKVDHYIYLRKKVGVSYM
jgi:hypothetical protein